MKNSFLKHEMYLRVLPFINIEVVYKLLKSFLVEGENPFIVQNTNKYHTVADVLVTQGSTASATMVYSVKLLQNYLPSATITLQQ